MSCLEGGVLGAADSADGVASSSVLSSEGVSGAPGTAEVAAVVASAVYTLRDYTGAASAASGYSVV